MHKWKQEEQKSKGQLLLIYPLWGRLLWVPWTTRKSNQSILKEINPEYSLEGLMLKLQYFGPPDVKSWLIRKDPEAGKDWRQEEKGTTEDEMVGWHQRLSGHEFEWTPGVGDEHGGLTCCSPWVAKCRPRLSDWTELNWVEFTGKNMGYGVNLLNSHSGFNNFDPCTLDNVS